MVGSCGNSNEKSGFIKGREFNDQLSDHELSMKLVTENMKTVTNRALRSTGVPPHPQNTTYQHLLRTFGHETYEQM
jgi:hypothetical protein